jgi:hypothetical protein
LLICQLLEWLALFALGAVLTHAQVAVPAVPPPGTTSEDMAQFVGWIRFLGYFFAVLFILGSCYAATHKHNEMGIAGIAVAVLLIVIAANAGQIGAMLYKPNA